MSDLMTKVWQALYHTQTDGSTCFPEVARVISGHETMGTGRARHWPALALTCCMPTDLYKLALDMQPSSLTPSLIMADNKSRAVTTHSFSHAVNGLRVALWPLRSATITPHSPISSGQRNNDLCKCWIALMKDITWYSRLAKYVLITRPRFCRWRLFSIFRTDFTGTVVEYFGSDL